MSTEYRNLTDEELHEAIIDSEARLSESQRVKVESELDLRGLSGGSADETSRLGLNYETKATAFRVLAGRYVIFASIVTGILALAGYAGIAGVSQLASIAIVIAFSVIGISGGYLLSRQSILGFWLVIGVQSAQLLQFFGQDFSYDLLAPIGVLLTLNASGSVGLSLSFSPGLDMTGYPDTVSTFGFNLLALFIIGRLLFEKAWWSSESESQISK